MLYNIKLAEEIKFDETWTQNKNVLKLINFLKTNEEIQSAINGHLFQLSFKLVSEFLGTENINIFTTLLLKSNIDFLNDKAIPDFCFYGVHMSYIRIPDNIEELGSRCFGCSRLEKIYIPKSVKSWHGINPFLDTSRLKEIEYEGTKKEFNKYFKFVTPDGDACYLFSTGATIKCSDGEFTI